MIEKKMTEPYLGSSENNQNCPVPPYNANNFNAANAPIYTALQNYAHNSPQYPLPTGSNAQEIYRNNQNISYFNSMNQQTIQKKIQNGTTGKAPYPQFRSEAERIMYIQGQTMTAARNQFTGQNPSAPAGVPCASIYGIIAPPQ